MRVAPLLMATLLLSGCLQALACPGCHDQWLFEGVDRGLYAALPAANGTAEHYSDWNGSANAMPLRAPALDAAWGRYQLMQVDWHDPRMAGGEPALRMFVSPRHPDTPNVSVWRLANVSEDEAMARLDAFLANVTDASPAARRAAVDMARATARPGGEWRGEDGTTRVTAWSHEANLTSGWRTQELWDEVAADATLTEHDVNGGSAVAQPWLFVLLFPVRNANLEGEAGSAWIRVNEHGAFDVLVRPAEPGREDDARAALAALLAEAGVDASPDAWAARWG